MRHQHIQHTYRFFHSYCFFNSRSIRYNAFGVVDILNTLYILVVAEHCLSKHTLSFLSLFTLFLNVFINDCHLIPRDTLLLPSDAFTYVSDAHCSGRCLDHVLTTHSSHSSIYDMALNMNVSRPTIYLCFTVSAKLLPSSDAPTQEQIQPPCPVWNAATPRISITIIQKMVCFNLQFMYLVKFCCTNPNCNDEAHRTVLCKLYNDTINSLTDAAETIPTKASNTSSKYTVLDWNCLVRDSHQASRESFLT